MYQFDVVHRTIMLINTWLCNVNTLNNARFWEGDFSFPFFKTQIYNCRRFNIITCCSFHEDFVQTSNFQVLLHNFWTPLNNNFPNKHVKQVEGSRLCAIYSLYYIVIMWMKIIVQAFAMCRFFMQPTISAAASQAVQIFI